MKTKLLIAALATAALAAPAFADDVVEVREGVAASQDIDPASLNLREGQMVYSTDGSRIGRIYKIEGDKDAPTAIRLIVDSKMLVIPAETLLPHEKKSRVFTSIASADLD